MNGDTLAITLDRIKFYARDAVVTLTQVSQPLPSREELTANYIVVYLQAVRFIYLLKVNKHADIAGMLHSR